MNTKISTLIIFGLMTSQLCNSSMAVSASTEKLMIEDAIKNLTTAMYKMDASVDKEDYIHALFVRGKLYMEISDYRRAGSDFREAAMKEEDINRSMSSSFWIMSAYAALMNDDISGFQMRLYSARLVDPSNPDAWYFTAMDLADQEKYDVAYEYFQKARDLGYAGDVTPEEESANYVVKNR